MNIEPAPLSDLLILTPVVHEDDRGFLYESFRAGDFAPDLEFVQDNHSFSRRNVLRGMHYQLRAPQGKLVRAVQGEIFNATVDLRRSSPTYGKWFGIVLSAANRRQLYVPPGFAHGFLTLSETSDVLYKMTASYSPADQHCLRYDDPAVSIAWPLTDEPVLSDKDRQGSFFAALEHFA